MEDIFGIFFSFTYLFVFYLFIHLIIYLFIIFRTKVEIGTVTIMACFGLYWIVIIRSYSICESVCVYIYIYIYIYIYACVREDIMYILYKHANFIA